MTSIDVNELANQKLYNQNFQKLDLERNISDLINPLMRLTNEVSPYFPMLSVYVHSQHLQQTLIPTNRILLPHCLKKDIVDVETKIYFIVIL